MGKITILLPMYNEERTVGPMVRKLQESMSKHRIEHEILAVNDGSKDRTAQRLAELKKKVRELRVVTHKVNMGLGAALQTGFHSAKTDVIVTMDTDLTQDPACIPSLLMKIEHGYDVVIGSRYVNGGGMRDVPMYRILVSRFANAVFGLLFLTSIRDMTSGFRCYRGELVKDMIIVNRGFQSQLEILINCLSKGAKVTEVPFVLVARSIGESKYDIVKDAEKYFLATLQLLAARFAVKLGL